MKNVVIGVVLVLAQAGSEQMLTNILIVGMVVAFLAAFFRALLVGR